MSTVSKLEQYYINQLYFFKDWTFKQCLEHIVPAFSKGGPGNYEEYDLFKNVYDKLRSNQTLIASRYIDIKNCPFETEMLSLDSPGDELDFYEIDKIAKLNNHTKQDLYDNFPPFTYNINSQGLRNDYDLDDMSEDYIPVFGDSHTFGVGVPQEWIWFKHLNLTHTYNVGIRNCTLAEIYFLMTKLYKEKPFKQTYVFVCNPERFTNFSRTNLLETLSGTWKNHLKEFRHADMIRDTSRYFYTFLFENAISDFCKINNIDLHLKSENYLYPIKLHIQNDLIGPPHMITAKDFFDVPIKTLNNHTVDIKDHCNYVARDGIHYGKRFHELLAKDFV